MKLNEGQFPSGTVIIHVLDKPYQEINFKSYLNRVLVCKNALRFTHVPCDFIPICAHFCSEMEK